MQGHFNVKDYRQHLWVTLERRCQNNPKYSLRAFARDLKISPSRLSEVLNGKYGLSRDAAVKISNQLGLSENEKSYFCDLVDSSHARSKKQRSDALARIEARKGTYNELSSETFSVISDWYHFAILELIQLRSFVYEPSWIAKSLSISLSEAKVAVERLLHLGLVEIKNKKLVLKNAFNASTNEIPSEAIKKYHCQILGKATRAIQYQGVEERDFSSVLLAFDDSRMSEAKEMIKDFRREFNKRFSASEDGTHVYSLGVQFFRITEKY